MPATVLTQTFTYGELVNIELLELLGVTAGKSLVLGSATLGASAPFLARRIHVVVRRA
jgi:hypothetical protein